MTHRKVEFHPQASEEYLAAFEWYFLKNELVAVRFAGEVRRAIELIAKAPDRWPEYARGIRKFVLRGYPFVIVYRERSSTIQVLAVAHGIAGRGIGKHESRNPVIPTGELRLYAARTGGIVAITSPNRDR
jgi:plasmid stabilization system protein ParE